MQPAFFFAVVFPPPSACAEVLPRSDRASAGRTSDAYKAFIMKRIIGNIEFVDVFSNGFRIPMQERIVLKDPIAFIPFDELVVPALGRLFCAQSRHPNRLALQGAL